MPEPQNGRRVYIRNATLPLRPYFNAQFDTRSIENKKPDSINGIGLKKTLETD